MPSISYDEAIIGLQKISELGSKPGLERISLLLHQFDNPHKNFKCILISGTNGKGSTASFLSAILQSSGQKTGLFISPHIFSFRDRIQINGQSISKSDFANIFFQINEKSKLILQKPTFFEVITAMAFLYFSQKKCDWAVLEVGMGGRLDATNICDPELSIITNVSLDHTAHLGNSIDKIAFEKSAIMRKAKPFVCACNHEDFDVLQKLAKQNGAYFHCVKDLFSICSFSANSITVKYQFLNERCAKINSSAHYQAQNSACASYAAHLLGIDPIHIINGIESITLGARWQTIQENPRIIIDCAHNPGAFLQIEPMLKSNFEKNSSILLFCAMKDKDYKTELMILHKYFETAVFCSLAFERAQKASELEKCAKAIGFMKTSSIESAKDAFLYAKKISNKKSLIFVCGSIYLLQELFGESGPKLIG